MVKWHGHGETSRDKNLISKRRPDDAGRRISGLIRLTSGEFKGRVIKAPGGAVHPMGARERLSVLNSVAPVLLDANVLDVYAGTGALGLESISRRAAHVTFVERSPGVAKVLRENIRMLGVERQCEVAVMSVERFVNKDYDWGSSVRGFFMKSLCYNVIFADPPYTDYQPEHIVPLEKFLAKGGLLVISHPKGSSAPHFRTLQLKSLHLHAGCTLSIFSKNIL